MKYYQHLSKCTLIGYWLSLTLGCQSWLAPLNLGVDASKEVPQQPEDTINQLLMVDAHFEDAMLAKQLDAATLLLGNAEHLLATASPLTRGHPDFEDLTTLVHGNRARLQKAQEADRLQRRNTHIDSLIDEGEQAVQQSEQLLVQIDPSVAQSVKLQRINELLAVLQELCANGQTFVDEPRYAKHLQALKITITHLVGAQTQLNLQLQATQQITPLIDAAITALRIAQGATDDQSQQTAYRQVMQNFANCARVLDTFINQRGFAPNLQINTALGQLSMQQTQQKCLNASAQAKTYLPTQPSQTLPHKP